MIEARAPRRLTLEVVAHAENEPPACNRFNSDMNLRIRSERIASFTRALRRCARGWLQQLQERVHAEILRVASVELINFSPFMHGNFPDFDDASVELINFEGQEGTWHTDGGASLLDAVVTIFGSHDLVVEASLHASGVTYAQQPGGTPQPGSIVGSIAQARQEAWAAGRPTTRSTSLSCFEAASSESCETASPIHASIPRSALTSCAGRQPGM